MGGRDHLQSKIFFLSIKKTGKMLRAQGKDRKNTGNFVLMGAWQPCQGL